MCSTIVFVERVKANGIEGPTRRFASVAKWAREAGHRIEVIHEPCLGESSTDVPILTALNRAEATIALVASYRLAQTLIRLQPDIVIAPLREGIAQSALMARACGEGLTTTRFALWHDGLTKSAFLAGDGLTDDLASLLCDAMERQCLALADMVVLPDTYMTDDTWTTCTQERQVAALDPEVTPSAGRPHCAVQEIVFVGAVLRSSGVIEFIEAIERLAADGSLRDLKITFLGPARDFAHGISKQWLGQRASNWAFPFAVVSTCDRSGIEEYIKRPGRLAVSLSDDPGELSFIRTCSFSHVLIPRRLGMDGSLVPALVHNVRKFLEGSRPDQTAKSALFGSWERIIARLAERNVIFASSPVPPVTVCILHYNRVEFLARALASVPSSLYGHPVSIIVIDNASTIPNVEAEIRAAGNNRADLRIISLAAPLAQATAYNLGLAAADTEVVMFLDDDNFFAPDGVERLATAIVAGEWDIAVTSLDIFDGEHDLKSSSGTLLFLGTAHSVGLFFNAFGDTAMAVRRGRFLALGGFHDLGYNYPSFDWVSLAGAQANGLRIGALQKPAVRYRRDTDRSDQQWIKTDEEGSRSLVFSVYKGAYDADLVARYAQRIHMRDL